MSTAPKEAPPKTRGGRREGAGRKAADGATDLVPVGVRIRRNQKSVLARLGGSVWVRQQIDESGKKQMTYKIGNAAESQYHGAGWAVAAIIDNEVAALRYIDDVAPPRVCEAMHADSAHAAFFVGQWLQTPEAAATLAELGSLGQVSVGMCSCWEFVEQ